MRACLCACCCAVCCRAAALHPAACEPNEAMRAWYLDYNNYTILNGISIRVDCSEFGDRVHFDYGFLLHMPRTPVCVRHLPARPVIRQLCTHTPTCIYTASVPPNATTHSSPRSPATCTPRGPPLVK